MNPNRDHYQILGIDPKASEDEIRKAYKKLARIYHPDLNPKRPRSAHDRFRRLQEAYDVLSDPISRQQYDQSLGIGQTKTRTNEAGQTETESGPWTVDIDQEETRERWLDRFNWPFIGGLLLSILSASWLVYIVNFPPLGWGRARADATTALMLFFLGIGLILYDTFSSKPRQQKLEAEEESLREEILAMLRDAGESPHELNDYLYQTIGKPGILSLELSELKQVKEYLQGHQRTPSSQTYASYHPAPGEYVRPKYKDHERTVYFPDEKEKTRWLENIGWRRKLAVVVWAVCLLGAFLPGTIWVTFFLRLSASEAPSFGMRLLWPTIALILIWIGKRMSDDDGLQTSIGAVGNQTIGYLLEVPGWLMFAYVMYGTLTGFVGYLSS
jgi:curved DNA-binding protein CbpA